LTYINFLKLRFGYFNLINQYENCTYGIGLGPPFLRLEYGRIDDFGLLDDNTNTFEDERELISLTFRNSFQL
ncbi:MAG TPA: hypothetical protein VHP63_06080, partial [candidate division Zixibacteria bacterium]|nr:hypothetical protein [candidate division Zixibacteria bacterium]